MNIPAASIARPVATTLLMLGLLFFGLVAYFSLPVSYLPEVEFPTIEVSASLPGASAQTMASSVASPLEREFAGINGIVAMNSSNSKGSTSITLQFELNRDIDGAAMDVQAAISAAGDSLPDTMTSPPTFAKVNPADSPVLYFAVTSPAMELSTVNDYVKTMVVQNLSMVSGVSQVVIYGEKKYAVRIRLDPRQLASRSLGINEVAEAVRTANVNLPLGDLEGRAMDLTIEANGQLFRAPEYRNVIVAVRDGRPVYLEDLGSVENGVQNDRFSSWYQGRNTLILAVKRQPGSNTLEVVERVKEKLPWIHSQLPASIQMDIVYDMSVFIEESVEDVKLTLLIAVVLVVLVVFVFLRNLAGTFVASVAIPFSLVATFGLMYFYGFSLDTLSLMALTLAIGFVVDDAIVMLENVVRHLEMGKPPLKAALDGSREITFTIISMTLSLAVVFIPMLFMSGVIGRVMHEFAMTIMLAILISGVVSLSLTPMLCSRALKAQSRLAGSGRVFNLLTRGYEITLGWALKLHWLTMCAAVALLGLTIYLFAAVPKDFLPPNDMNYFMGFAQARQGIPYESMLDHQQKLDAIISGHPDVRGVISIVGVPMQNQGMLVVMLTPQQQRKADIEEIIGELWPQSNSVPGVECFLMNPPMIELGSRSSKGAYIYTLTSANTELLYEKAEELEAALRALPQLNGVNSDLQIDNPEVFLKINRELASYYGVTAMDLEESLYTAYASREVSTIYAENDEYKVIMELLPEFQRDSSALSMVYVRASNGNLVRLDGLAEVSPRFGPSTVNHTGQLPSVTFSFNTQPGVSLEQATRLVSATASNILPDDISTDFEGTAGEFASSIHSLLFLLLLAIAVIYIILGCLYESFLHPLTILSGLPSAALGGLLTLRLFNMTLDLYGFVGIIMLIGIVKKNAIMVVDFAQQAEKQGLSPEKAAFQGSLVRFRPIMMTTLAAIMGAVPIALGLGAGGEARQPLGLVVVGGLVLSQVVTLFITPVFYVYMDKLRLRRNRGVAGEPVGTASAE